MRGFWTPPKQNNNNTIYLFIGAQMAPTFGECVLLTTASAVWVLDPPRGLGVFLLSRCVARRSPNVFNLSLFGVPESVLVFLGGILVPKQPLRGILVPKQSLMVISVPNNL